LDQTAGWYGCLSPVLLLIELLGAASAFGQTSVSIVSTIELQGSAESRVARVLEALADGRKTDGWSYQFARCDELGGQLGAGPVAILTTPDCLESVRGIELSTISANVGFRLYMWTRGTELKSGVKIGILASENRYRSPIKNALSMLWDVHVDVIAQSAGNAHLLQGLKDHDFDIIGVIDDGSGTGPRTFSDVKKDSDGVKPLALKDPVGSSKESVAEGAMIPLGIPSRLVDPPLRNAEVRPDETVLAFAVARAEAAPDPDDRLNSALAWIPGSTPVYAAELEPEAEHDPNPLPAVSPILVTRGQVPREIFETVRRALLAAPVDALMDPCLPRQTDLYRSLLRGAIDSTSPDRLALSALLEHAMLLDDTRQKNHLETLLSDSQRQDLVERFVKEDDGASCKPPRRLFFRGRKVAYYRYGVKRLRDALTASTIDTAGPAFTEAEACLRKAFKERHGDEPSCRESVMGMGMFTTYYAPYLPLAVIGTEGRDGPRR